MLALIPARGGSKGLPGKNIRPLADYPLIAHSIFMAKMCSKIHRIVVSTDDPKIAEIAKDYGAEVPFLRPKELARDDTPMWPVIRHALKSVETLEKEKYKYLLLLDPTSPGRTPDDVEKAVERLENNPDADGIIGVSRPHFNPIWHCVVEKDGWMKPLIEEGTKYHRRQDVPAVYRINASLYIWRCDFIYRSENDWMKEGRYLMHEIPEARAIHIDELSEFEMAELLIKKNLIMLPWIC
ncbi:MAG: acylneuraminate cytidylyltransferase family protein [Deltaproteobacteria bacterium]|nr:acylneuraminate cytidylyltransferase family protein [Deltaproteobacteria bacterium]MDZ4225055.1 acylneuraminate cytidylyltransferase family protein [bacterium]